MYESFNGIVLVEKEGKEIAACLGNKKAALLQNHGLLTVGETIEATVFWFLSMEKCCQAQLMADAAAGGRGHETIKISDEDAKFTYKVSIPKDWYRLCVSFRVDCGRFKEQMCSRHDSLSMYQVLKRHADPDQQTIGTPMAGFFSAKPLFDVIEKECNGEYLQ